jgi:hypothetical protein
MSKLPVANLIPVRSRNPLTRQKVRAKLVSSGRNIGGTGEFHQSGGYALHIAIKKHGIVGFTAGTTEASNGHYRIRIHGWTPEELRSAVQWLNGEHAS